MDLTLLGSTRRERTLTPLWQELAEPRAAGLFTPGLVDGLPAPARRFLLRAIAPGTLLVHAARLSMHGELRLKPGAEALPMRAEQVLAPPRGLIWKAHVGRGALQFRGYDRAAHGAAEMRWWLHGLVPLVRAQGPDVVRSAAGRLAGEAVLVPAALLPGPGVTWREGDADSAVYVMEVFGERVETTVRVDAQGRLTHVRIRRWRGAEGERPAGYADFDVDAWGAERQFGGYTVQTHFRAGWELATSAAFPFFYARVDSVEF